MGNSSVINLNKFRKSRARETARAQADQNTVLHGLSKQERSTVQMDRIRAETLLNGLQMGRPAKDPDTEPT